MSYQQLINPTPWIPSKPGWCLAYVNEAFGVEKRYPTAISAWYGSDTKHKDYNFPAGMWVPLWFSLKFEPAGHVALRAPDGRVFSTTSPWGNRPTEHPNLQHLINAYAANNPLTYLGWTEDVEGTPVMAAGLNPASTEEDDDMPISQDDVNRIAKAVVSFDIAQEGGVPGKLNLGGLLAWYNANNAAIVGNTVKDLMDFEVAQVGVPGKLNLGALLAEYRVNNNKIVETSAAWILPEVIALRELVTQLSAGQGVTIDYDKITKAVSDINYGEIAKAVNDDAAKRMQK